jgi:hypothetical protein
MGTGFCRDCDGVTVHYSGDGRCAHPAAHCVAINMHSWASKITKKKNPWHPYISAHMCATTPPIIPPLPPITRYSPALPSKK